MAEKKYLDNDGLLFYDTLVKERENKKVDKEYKTGSSSEYKVLSDNNLTDELKQKILNAGTGSFTGNYDDLTDIPTLDGIQIKGSLTKEELGIASQTWVTSKGYQNESEVQELINGALEDITGIDYQVVQQLPSTGEKGIIYLVPNSGTAPNVYDEYIWLSDKNTFEKIGTTAVDLSGYVKETDLIPISNEEIQQIVNPN